MHTTPQEAQRSHIARRKRSILGSTVAGRTSVAPCWPSGESGLQLPIGMLASGCCSSGRLARLARKWRIRQASTPESVAMCSTVGTPSTVAGSHERMGAMLQRWLTSVCTTCRASGLLGALCCLAARAVSVQGRAAALEDQ